MRLWASIRSLLLENPRRESMRSLVRGCFSQLLLALCIVALPLSVLLKALASVSSHPFGGCVGVSRLWGRSMFGSIRQRKHGGSTRILRPCCRMQARYRYCCIMVCVPCNLCTLNRTLSPGLRHAGEACCVARPFRSVRMKMVVLCDALCFLFLPQQVDLDKVDHSKFPLFKGAPFWDCILDQGEMLYIPPRFWHYVRSLSLSFSVSFWWE